MLARFLLVVALLVPTYVGDSTPGGAVVEFDSTGITAEHYHGAGISADSVFLWGSVSKSFAATLVLLLADEGLVEVHAPVTNYFPEFSDTAFGDAGATVANLINHTSGLPRDLSLRNPPEGDVIATIAKLRSVDPPGEFAYSNLGYQLLGKLVERVTGLSYGQALNARIPQIIGTDPLIADAETFSNEVPPGHAPFFGTTMTVTAQPYADGFAYGYLSGTPRQLAAWGVWQLNQHQMGGLPSKFPRNNSDYGAGLEYYTDTGSASGEPVTVVQHNGALIGYHTQLIFSPETGRGVVIVSNEFDLLRPENTSSALELIGVSSPAENPPPLKVMVLGGLIAYSVVLIISIVLGLRRFGSGPLTRRQLIISLLTILFAIGGAWVMAYGVLMVFAIPSAIYEVSYTWAPDLLFLMWVNLVLCGCLLIVSAGSALVRSKRRGSAVSDASKSS